MWPFGRGFRSRELAEGPSTSKSMAEEALGVDHRGYGCVECGGEKYPSQLEAG